MCILFFLGGVTLCIFPMRIVGLFFQFFVYGMVKQFRYVVFCRTNLHKGVTFKNYLRKGVYFVNIYAGGHFLHGTRQW